MLSPIDTAAVIRDGGAIGRHPKQIHEAVGWWLGACLVVTLKASGLAVAHDGHRVSARFADRLCQGAINAQHYACTVHLLGHASEQELLATAKGLESPAAWLSTEPTNDTVRIRLYTRHGTLLDESTGLSDIRDLIDCDHVPIPVNTKDKGTIESWPPPMADGARS
ncbi:hypothetical protein [Streptomyces fructofermentans]|uniref:Uncharacterized protein n=1 Tax=Streptomyces fructofermentans TaxID=152141 RepID=A0A918U6H5_9ACTN|nr:hypothetical protein [Streptomyces fructofermentans]GGX98059.1 hypothetical protein GCM10010515_75440 [Streptomyces fructofermentans]